MKHRTMAAIAIILVLAAPLLAEARSPRIGDHVGITHRLDAPDTRLYIGNITNMDSDMICLNVTADYLGGHNVTDAPYDVCIARTAILRIDWYD